MSGEKELRASGEELWRYLPHRAPFLFVDEVSVEAGEQPSEGRIAGSRRFTEKEFFFAGHFPEYPVVPGVILIETMAQCGGVGARLMGIEPDGVFFLVRVTQARFRKQVRPGDVFSIEVQNLRASSSIVHQKGRGYVDGALAAEAEWLCMAGPRSE